MKKILITLLMLLSSVANAAWVSYGETDLGKYYVDPERVSQNGSYMTVWTKVNLFNPKPNSAGNIYRSSMQSYMVDCRGQRQALRALVYYAGQDGQGTVLNTYDYTNELKWNLVVPNSIGEALLTMLCR